MMDRTLHGPFENRREPHLMAAALAVLLSFVTHLAVMWTVADWHLGAPATATESSPNAVPPETPPTRIEMFESDPQIRASDPEIGEPREGAGVPRERVGELARLPDPALLTPPSLSREALAGTMVNLQAPARPPETSDWQPRQQIMAVLDKQIKDELATLPRRPIPNIERVARAPDYVPSVDVSRERFGRVGAPAPRVEQAPAAEEVAGRQRARIEEGLAPELPEEAEIGGSINRFSEPPEEITSYAAVDDRLAASLVVHQDPVRDRNYFRLRIARRSAATLPVTPKDIVFVQDSSRSLAEERLYFCRKALREALRKLPAIDRFNVVSFSDAATFCFQDWAPVNNDTLRQADAFVAGLRSGGDTDIYASMRALLEVPRDPTRPMIAVVITDGRSTTGLMASTDIIGEFTRHNTGAFSVFALGTHGRANHYLLDLLTYCNRGASTVVTSGRWDIPQNIGHLIDGVARPVLGNVEVDVNLASGADLHPLPSANLYADRALEYYGSCPANVTNLAMQVRGEAGPAKCDVVFSLDLATAPRGNDQLRQEWARRRVHSLIGAYARRPDDQILEALQRVSRDHDVPIPYRRDVLRRR